MTERIINAMTIDVEDYYHTEAMSEVVRREDWPSMASRVQQHTELLLETFAKRNVKATLFFLGYVAEQYPALVSEAVKQGHEIACHSFWHRPVFRLSPEEFREDTTRAKEAIETAGNVKVQGY